MIFYTRISRRTLTIALLMASFWSIFSCKSKQEKQVDNIEKFQPKSEQDSTNKKVTQTIADETLTFDYSDFNDLKNNKSYERILAGQIDLPTGKVVCTDPMYRELPLPQTWTIQKGQYPASGSSHTSCNTLFII